MLTPILHGGCLRGQFLQNRIAVKPRRLDLRRVLSINTKARGCLFEATLGEHVHSTLNTKLCVVLYAKIGGKNTGELNDTPLSARCQGHDFVQQSLTFPGVPRAVSNKKKSAGERRYGSFSTEAGKSSGLRWC